jgi:hypothetical protein
VRGGERLRRGEQCTGIIARVSPFDDPRSSHPHAGKSRWPWPPAPVRDQVCPAADGADHERFTSLLRADGYAVGYGAAQDLWHGIGILGGSPGP